jgi:HrpA-like RNA helicase
MPVSHFLFSSLERVDESILNLDLIEDLINLIVVKKDYSALAPPDNVDMSTGSILVFLPGVGEIRDLCDRLVASVTLQKADIDVLPLHSMLSSDEQRLAFVPSRPGTRKIIVSTNIAETSVTIPDVTCGKCTV